jgi:predicted solute-binding protein
MERVVHISRSFEEAEEWDLQQYRSMTPEQRLDILQYLREEYYKFKNEDRKGFQRVYRIVKQK